MFVVGFNNVNWKALGRCFMSCEIRLQTKKKKMFKMPLTFKRTIFQKEKGGMHITQRFGDCDIHVF